jgi:hypothetical protein
MTTQMIKKVPTFDGIRKFITTFTKAARNQTNQYHTLISYVSCSYRTLLPKARNFNLKLISLSPALVIRSKVNMVLKPSQIYSRDFEARLVN